MAICEVINHPTTQPKRGTKGSEVYVVPDEDLVVTRYLIVYSGGGIGNLHASALTYPQYLFK